MDFLNINVGVLVLPLTLILIPTLLLLLSSLAAKTAKISKKRLPLPPGPTPLPIIGNLHKLGKLPHQSLAELAKIYGPIMSLKFGRITTIVVTSSTLAKEVLQKQDLAFSSRSIPDAVHAHSHNQFSVVFLPVNPRWRSLRKIMKEHIFSGNRLDANQHLRRSKVEDLMAYCRKSSQSGEAVDIGRAAFRTSLNSLSNTIFSKDLADPNQDSAKEFKFLVTNIMSDAGKPNLVDFFPALTKIDPQGFRRRLTVYIGKVIEVFDGLVNERLELRKKLGGNTAGLHKDMLEACLNINEENPEMDKTLIEHMFLDLFVAGTDTTSSAVEWAMIELLRNPEAMVEAKAELEQVIGKGMIVEEADVSRLPYLRSIVKETLRLHPPVPMIPRLVASDVEVNGYFVPKGANVLVNAWAIGRDPTLWEDSLAFKPERFLTSEIDIHGQHFELLPLGAGRRICPGLSLANRMFPVMLGSLVNSFNWKLDGGMGPNELDIQEEFGISLHNAQSLRAIPMPITM